MKLEDISQVVKETPFETIFENLIKLDAYQTRLVDEIEKKRIQELSDLGADEFIERRTVDPLDEEFKQSTEQMFKTIVKAKSGEEQKFADCEKELVRKIRKVECLYLRSLFEVESMRNIRLGEIDEAFYETFANEFAKAKFSDDSLLLNRQIIAAFMVEIRTKMEAITGSRMFQTFKFLNLIARSH